MRKLLLSAFFLSSVLFGSAQSPASAPPQETVIQPRGSSQAQPVGSGAVGGSGGSSLYLALALLAGAGGWWLWIKRKGGMGGVAGKPGLLKIAETRSLGSRQYLVVADYDGQKFLLGVCPGSIQMLTPLNGATTPPKES